MVDFTQFPIGTADASTFLDQVEAARDEAVAASRALTEATPVAVSGVTSVSFAIPAGTKEIMILLDEVSTDGTNNLLVQLEDGEGVEGTGYVSSSGNRTAESNETGGFGIRVDAAGDTTSGIVYLYRMSEGTHRWHSTHDLTGGGTPVHGAGVKLLDTELVSVRILSILGDTFDGGNVNVLYR